MRIPLAVSLVALAVSALATPSEAQSIRRNGGPSISNGSGGGFSQRTFRQPRSFNGPSASSRNLESGARIQRRAIQPPAPGGNVAGNQQRRSFRTIQPPAPGGNVAGNQQPRSFRTIQPPAPGGNVAGNQQPRSFRTIQPPAPGGNVAQAGGSRGSFIPAAAAATAIGTAAIASRPAAASQPAVKDSANDVQKVEATPVADKPVAETPPSEMLAQVGAPIVPLDKAPATTNVVTSSAPAKVVVRRVAEAEQCNVPVHRYRSWRRYSH